MSEKDKHAQTIRTTVQDHFKKWQDSLAIWKQNKQEIRIAARLLHGPQYFFSTFDGAQLFSSVLCYAKLSCLQLFNK